MDVLFKPVEISIDFLPGGFFCRHKGTPGYRYHQKDAFSLDNDGHTWLWVPEMGSIPCICISYVAFAASWLVVADVHLDILRSENHRHDPTSPHPEPVVATQHHSHPSVCKATPPLAFFSWHKKNQRFSELVCHCRRSPSGSCFNFLLFLGHFCLQRQRGEDGTR